MEEEEGMMATWAQQHSCNVVICISSIRATVFGVPSRACVCTHTRAHTRTVTQTHIRVHVCEREKRESKTERARERERARVRARTQGGDK